MSGAERGHGHSHGIVDASITTSARGLWAIKWSFIGLAVTAAIQLVVVIMSNSVALLADTIHNLGDAATAIPLGIAFLFAKRPPTRRFTYGFGRVEDLAGLAIVLTIFASAVVAAYQAVNRLVHPQPVTHLGAIIVASIIGFAGNELVALFRIRVGREIGSAALIADGYHARTDGSTIAPFRQSHQFQTGRSLSIGPPATEHVNIRENIRELTASRFMLFASD